MSLNVASVNLGSRLPSKSLPGLNILRAPSTTRKEHLVPAFGGLGVAAASLHRQAAAPKTKFGQDGGDVYDELWGAVGQLAATIARAKASAKTNAPAAAAPKLSLRA